MARRNRKPDLRLIRPTSSYTAKEVAELLGVTVGTVHAWIRTGLPCLKDIRPWLIPGDSLKAWLKERQSSHRWKCGYGELSCFGCRAARKPINGSVTIRARNQKVTMISGRCVVCGGSANRGGSVSRMHEAIQEFGLLTMGQTSLSVSDNPIVKPTYPEEPDAA